MDEHGRASGSSDVGVIPRRSAKKISQEEVSEGPCRNFLSYECILLFPSHVLVKKHKNKKVLRISMCMHDKMVTKSRGFCVEALSWKSGTSVQNIILQQKLGY